MFPGARIHAEDASTGRGGAAETAGGRQEEHPQEDQGGQEEEVGGDQQECGTPQPIREEEICWAGSQNTPGHFPPDPLPLHLL